MKNKLHRTMFGLNEVRIERSLIEKIPARLVEFPKEKRNLITHIENEPGLVVLFRGDSKAYLFNPKQDWSRVESLLETIGATKENRSINLVGDVWPSVQISVIRKIIEKTPRERPLYRAGDRRFMSIATVNDFTEGYYAANVDIRDCGSYFSILVDPTIITLLPLNSFSNLNLFLGRSVIKVPLKGENAEDQDYGYIGRIKKIENLTSERILVVGLPKSDSEDRQHTISGLMTIATKEEIRERGLFGDQKKSNQMNSNKRHERTEQWIKRLFPENNLTLGERVIEIQDCSSRPINYASGDSASADSGLILDEPEISFSPEGDRVNRDQFNGLRTYGPFDSNSQSRKIKKIHPIIVYPNSRKNLVDDIGRLMGFLSKGYKKRETGYDIDFPGVDADKFLKIPFVTPGEDDVYETEFSREGYTKVIEEIITEWKLKGYSPNERIVLVVVPDEFSAAPDDPYAEAKKLLLENNIPSQMIEFSTLSDSGNRAFGNTLFNLSLSLYVKMGGKPWTLNRKLNDVNCLIGIGFGIDSKHEGSIYVGVANLFDQAGQWLSHSSHSKELTSEEAKELQEKEFKNRQTNSYKLQEEFTYRLILNTLLWYKTNHNGAIASKIVLHKNGWIFECEARGALKAIVEVLSNGGVKIESLSVGLVSIIKNHDFRLYSLKNSDDKNSDDKTIVRGAAYIVDENNIILATTGRDSYKYRGIGTPVPLLISRFAPDRELLLAFGLTASQLKPTLELAEQAFALTRLQWASFRNIRLPVTSEYAQRIAHLVAQTGVNINHLDNWEHLWWV